MEATDFLQSQSPLERLSQWLDESRDVEKTGRALREPNAMLLSTSDAHGNISARVVLLKEIRPQGLVFFTNYLSRKGRDIAVSPQVALTFYWDALQRQVRIQGRAETLSSEESDSYWNSRPRASQLSQYISSQSEPLTDRATLELAYQKTEALFKDQKVPRPAHWGGYVVVPESFEFWIGHPHRLHDRFYYERQPSGWSGSRLFP